MSSEEESYFKFAVVEPNEFNPVDHFYPGILDLEISPLVLMFMQLAKGKIAARYCEMYPKSSYDSVMEILSTNTRHFKWAGADLMHVIDRKGKKSLTVIETNSCPSGQKSCPPRSPSDPAEVYRTVLARSFLPGLKESESKYPEIAGGALAVIYDKNPMEASGYCAVLATLTNEKVYFVPFTGNFVGIESRVRFDSHGVMEVKDDDGNWIRIRGAYRYVTQKPWDRIPVNTKTYIFNPIRACLSGGRNKITAAYAYSQFNTKQRSSGLEIDYPATKINVAFGDLRREVESLDYVACVKIPYSNAGQGVFVMNCKDEFDAFMDKMSLIENIKECKFLVQDLLGLDTEKTHVGTIPDSNGNQYVFDLRMMVSSGEDGFKPLVVYARKAHAPLPTTTTSTPSSSPSSSSTTSEYDCHDYFVTNLSIKVDGRPGEFTSDTSRLVPAAVGSFHNLGLGMDELIKGYVQTCMAVTAIDDLCETFSSDDKFSTAALASINNDDNLIREIHSATSSTC